MDSKEKKEFNKSLQYALVILYIAFNIFGGCYQQSPTSPSPAQIENMVINFGGTNLDGFSSAAQTPDGGFILAGVTYSFGAGEGDAWIVKIDSTGGKVWERVYGGSEEDEVYEIRNYDDNTYVLLGYTESFGNGKSDVWLLTIDGNGQLISSRTFGGEERDYGTGLDITANGEYVLCGSVDGTFFIYYLDASQNIKWKHEWPKEDEDINIYDVKWTPDNEIVATGESYGKYIIVIKLSGSGDLLWQKRYFSEKYTQATRRGNCINVTSDNGYIITGVGNTYKSRDNIGSNYEAILLKVTEDGSMIWSKIIDRISVELFYRTFENSDHEIVAFGRTFDGANVEVGAWLAVFNQNGEMKREVLYGKYGFIFGNFCSETSNGRYILAGSTYNGNGCVMLVDKKGMRIW